MMPIRVAAADIGSNALRFLAVECTDARDWRVLQQVRVPLRLGRDVFLAGTLSAATIAEAMRALVLFGRILQTHGIDTYRAVATSALRESANGRELVAAAQSAAGVRVEIIDGTEEARLVYVAVRERLRLDARPRVLVDLGGGSLEISLIDERGISATRSLPIGAVRMLEAVGERADVQAFRRHLDTYELQLQQLPALRSAAHDLIATGGNIEAIAKIAGVQPNARGVTAFPVSAFDATIAKIAAASVPERQARWQLHADRADVVLPAALVYQRVAALAEAHEIIVPGVGVKEGIVLDLLATRS